MEIGIEIEKAFKLSANIVKLHKHLKEEKKESVLSEKLLNCGISIGEILHEEGWSHKISVKACKRAKLAMYWLKLLKEGEYLDETDFPSIIDDTSELIKLLESSAKNIGHELFEVNDSSNN